MTCNVTGILYAPDGTVCANQVVTFTRKGTVEALIDGGATKAIIPKTITAMTDGAGAIDVDLFAGPYDGYTSRDNGRDGWTFLVGVPQDASAQIGDIISQAADYSGIANEVAASATAASDAAAAAEAAALTADVHKADFTTLDAATDIISGQIVDVADGFNGQRENGLIVAAGTYTADGSLVRDLTGSGLQWVSYRREYATISEADSDPRSLVSGTITTIPSIGAKWEVVSTGQHFTTSGGNKVFVHPEGYGPVSKMGQYNPAHFSSDDDTAWARVLTAAAGAKIAVSEEFLLTAGISIPSGTKLKGYGGSIAIASGIFDTVITISGTDKVQLFDIDVHGETGADAGNYAISIIGANRTTIRGGNISNMGIEASGASEKGGGINISGNSTRTKIFGTDIRDIKGYGASYGDCITIRDSDDTKIDSVTLGVCRRQQIAIVDDATNIVINDPTGEDGYLAFIDIEPNSINTTGKITINNPIAKNWGSKPGATTGTQYHAIDVHDNCRQSVVVNNPTFTAGSAQAVSCIYAINNSDRLTISGGNLYCGGYCDGIKLYSGSGSTNTQIRGVRIYDPKTYGIDGSSNKRIAIQDCWIESSINTTLHGINLNGGTNGSFPTITGNTIILTGTGVGRGINMSACDKFVVVGNTVDIPSGAVGAFRFYSNVAATTMGIVSGNGAYCSGTATTAYEFAAVGSGAFANIMFGANNSAGFTNKLVTSGTVSFNEDRMIGGALETIVVGAVDTAETGYRALEVPN